MAGNAHGHASGAQVKIAVVAGRAVVVLIANGKIATVADDGEAASHLDCVLDRNAVEDRRRSGLGLGLDLCKRSRSLVHGHQIRSLLFVLVLDGNGHGTHRDRSGSLDKSRSLVGLALRLFFLFVIVIHFRLVNASDAKLELRLGLGGPVELPPGRWILAIELGERASRIREALDDASRLGSDSKKEADLSIVRIWYLTG